ncbi:hypothetical protein HRI_001732200 [Hibiscus trionum]|uniref:Uncharacterized protein n=1 Tax=Hibiscus trionum TaxID=183268 RepID=A0A9W7LY19_HIBTR|nr:hypothetical protein HRI_001732200 [Hibiscus trionum]
MKSSSPHHKITRDYNHALVSADADVAYRTWTALLHFKGKVVQEISRIHAGTREETGWGSFQESSEYFEPSEVYSVHERHSELPPHGLRRSHYVKGLGLHDYYKVIEKPIDFSTIKNQMEAKDGTRYKNVCDICADVRLVFDNAMKYNEEGSDVHLMAKTLLEKFEEKWQLLLPKVTEEEKRREEEAETLLNMQLLQESSHAKMVQAISNELYEVDTHLEQLRDIVVRKCRKMSTEENRNLGTAIAGLSPEDLSKALEIIAQSNPGFRAMAEELEIDIDAQSKFTLWRLNFLVKDVSEGRNKSAANTSDDNNNEKRGTRSVMLLQKLSRKRVKMPSS